MKSFEKEMDDKLYYARYIEKNKSNIDRIWSSIKNNKTLLEWAIKPIKDKYRDKDIVNGTAICEGILMDYEFIDKDIYEKLVNLIYSNRDISRIVLDGYSNGGYSFLLITLCNTGLKLTDEQKNFAVDEAMNKNGTTRHEEKMNSFSKKLDEIGITDEETMNIGYGLSRNPVGAKTGNMFIANIVSLLNNDQAHGSGNYDIRYWILKNPNWSLEEKQKLIKEFWYYDEIYDENLEQWEWGIINDNKSMDMLDKNDLYDYTYEELLRIYGDKEITNRIWNEIQFCREMHKLRPQQWEVKNSKNFRKRKSKKRKNIINKDWLK